MDDNRNGIDPYDEFFTEGPLWKRIKSEHSNKPNPFEDSYMKYPLMSYAGTERPRMRTQEEVAMDNIDESTMISTPRCGTTKAKAGWYCTRDIDHGGPCSALPIGSSLLDDDGTVNESKISEGTQRQLTEDEKWPYIIAIERQLRNVTAQRDVAMKAKSKSLTGFIARICSIFILAVISDAFAISFAEKHSYSSFVAICIVVGVCLGAYLTNEDWS